MVTSIRNRATPLGRVLALGLALATLLATMLSAAPADAVVSSGKAFSWGYNYSGQLGNVNTGIDTNAPRAVRNLSGVKSVKAGCSHSLALKTDGTVYAWGDNEFGQLGNGTSGVGVNTNVPVKVKINNVKAISAGCLHTLTLKENGTVWTWGYNSYGQLGNGASGLGTDSNVPVQVATLGTGAKAIAAGNDFSLALMKDGTVNSWGNNISGQLGNGTDTPRDTPGPVSNLSGVKTIATDNSALHVLALLNDGAVKSWGDNYSGQLGNGSSLPGTKRSKPVRVTNLSGVEAVATGGDHSLALLGSGKVKSWGRNNHGELGSGVHGDGTERSTPGNVIGLSNVRSISGGAHHSLAVLESGRASSWGYNFYGQLGDGVFGTDTDVPVSVNNLSNVISMDGGFGLTVAATQ